ncbi:MAG: LacI family DNA-binding transcriptional regulator [Spirochaetia bacterium]|nr:LacI family DNA-binding transcriptional regulator [Spirochaetia bacterium]
MSITIKQIAELAGVSRGTVDKVLNGRPGVKAETRERVLKIADELDYKPNYLGKALVKSREKTRIGVILTPEYNPFVHEIIQGIHQAQDEFKLFGIEIEIKMLNTLEPAEQIGILHYFENENFAGVAVFPLNDTQVIRKVNSMSARGIAIITFNSRIKEINDICFIGQNHYWGGRTAAGLMTKLLPEGGETAVIISATALSCHQDRLKGFTDRIKTVTPEITIRAVKENQDRTESAFRIMLEYCNSYPDLKGLYITGGGCAGVCRALEAAEKTGRIKVISHDVVSDTLQLLNTGAIDFTLGQTPELQGYLLIKTLFEYLIKQQKPVSGIIDIPIEIITSDTLQYQLSNDPAPEMQE